MDLKWCTKLDVVQKCPIVSIHQISRSHGLTNRRFESNLRLLGRSQLSNPSDLPCFCCTRKQHVRGRIFNRLHLHRSKLFFAVYALFTIYSTGMHELYWSNTFIINLVTIVLNLMPFCCQYHETELGQHWPRYRIVAVLLPDSTKPIYDLLVNVKFSLYLIIIIVCNCLWQSFILSI